MEDNPPPPSPPRDWVCKKCGKTFATKTSHNAHQKTHGRYGKNQIVAPQRPEQPPEAWLGPRTRSFFTGSSPVRKVELGIGPDPSGRDPDNRPPTFYQFLPLPKEDKPGPKGS